MPGAYAAVHCRDLTESAQCKGYGMLAHRLVAIAADRLDRDAASLSRLHVDIGRGTSAQKDDPPQQRCCV